jgi:hypothetical protein
MSSLLNVITTEFRVRGGQAIAGMGQMGRSLTQLGNQVNQVGRMSERLNQQWRAIGTTIRYAIAGTAVFAMRGMVSQLKDFQVQMGLIQAISTAPGQRSISSSTLRSQQDDLRRASIEALTPVNELAKGLVNLVSSLQNVPQDKLIPMITGISKVAQIAQVDVESATQAFTSMTTAFGLTDPNQIQLNVRKMERLFFNLVSLAPGGKPAGQQMIHQFGQMAQMTRSAGGTPADLFATLLTILRSGIPPAQTGRGAQFMIQTLGFPGQQVAPSRAALASVGIRPGSTMTLQERFNRVFDRARQLGISGDPSKLNFDEEQAAVFDETGNMAAALAQAGIRGAGAEFLGKIFRRVHALRSALALSQNPEQREADLEIMLNAMANNQLETDVLADAWKKFEREASLQKAAVAVDALTLQIAQAFAPLFNLTARGLVRLQGVTNKLSNNELLAILGGGAATAGIIQLLRGRGIRGLGRGLKGVGGIAAAGASLTGDAPTGTAADPIFVWVMGSFSGGNPLARGRGAPPAGGGGRGGRIPRVPPIVAGLGVPTAATAIAAGITQIPGAGGAEGPGGARPGSALERAQQLWGTDVVGIDRPAKGIFKGEATLWISIEEKKADGTTKIRRMRVPVSMWENGRMPSKQGKPATGRR